METTLTQSFVDATKICKPLSKLVLPPEIEELLNSGKVLFYLDTSESGIACWPYFPIGNHRLIVRDLKKLGFHIPKEVKVIIEIGLTYGDEEITKYMLDCFGHAILYLLSPKAPNECEDAEKLIKKIGIRVLQT